MAQTLTGRIVLADFFPAFASRTSLRFATARLSLRPASVNPARTLPPRFFTSRLKPIEARIPRRLNSARHFWTSRIAQQEAKAAEGQEKLGLFDRVKDLTRRYGSVALVVYLGLGAIDFSLAFLLIYAIGADHVRAAEDWVLDQLHWRRKHPHERKPIAEEARDKVIEAEETVKQKANEVVQAISGEGEKYDKGHGDQSTLATTALLAYAIHKTALLPIRVGLVAWTTPKVVATLRGWGWNIGKPAMAASLALLTARRKEEEAKRTALPDGSKK